MFVTHLEHFKGIDDWLAPSGISKLSTPLSHYVTWSPPECTVYLCFCCLAIKLIALVPVNFENWKHNNDRIINEVETIFQFCCTADVCSCLSCISFWALTKWHEICILRNTLVERPLENNPFWEGMFLVCSFMFFLCFIQ